MFQLQQCTNMIIFRIHAYATEIQGRSCRCYMSFTNATINQIKEVRLVVRNRFQEVLECVNVIRSGANFNVAKFCVIHTTAWVCVAQNYSIARGTLGLSNDKTCILVLAAWRVLFPANPASRRCRKRNTASNTVSLRRFDWFSQSTATFVACHQSRSTQLRELDLLRMKPAIGAVRRFDFFRQTA